MSNEIPEPGGAAQAATVLVEPPGMDQPLPVDELFDPARPLEVDCGCGKGRFLMARAAAHPEVQFLGIDRMLGRTCKLDRKIVRAGLDNVRLLRMEAFYSLQRLLPPHRVRTIYIFFPDPWPKRRHHRRRLFGAEFRELLWTRLIPGGTVEVATDHLDYFAEIRKGMLADARFREVPHMVRGPEEQTDFELYYRSHGFPVGECAFQTVAAPP